MWLLQGWLAEYVAKAKDVAGVKEGSNGLPEEAPAAEAPAAEKRLVLYGRTQASPGLTGFFRTARTEPMGERLRLVCDATHPGPGPECTWSLDLMPIDGVAFTYSVLHDCSAPRASCIAQRFQASSGHGCSSLLLNKTSVLAEEGAHADQYSMSMCCLYALVR